MPCYEFRCPSCRATRDVRASLAEADGLGLVCTDCGATMTRGFAASVTVLTTTRSAAPAAPRAPSAGHPTCADGAVRLSRPNPFGRDPRAPEGGEHA